MTTKQTQTKARKAGIAALMALSLSVSAVTVPRAFAADAVGYDPTIDVVEKSQQKATDLNAGTCSFELSDQESRAGARTGAWTTDEQAPYDFGVIFTLDGSQQRTFNDVYVATSHKSVPYNGPDASALDLGYQRHGMKVNHQFDPLEYTSPPRGPKNLAGPAELTRELVAKAASEEGLTAGWSAEYTQLPTQGNRFFQETYFQATVNPWPSENADCSPVNIDWVDHNQKVVDLDNQQRRFKVGTVVGADKESLKRIRVNAYIDGKHVEGKTELDGNDLYYTWPEFIDQAWAGAQNVTFKAVALPRDLAAMKRDVASQDEDNQGYADRVFQESIDSLDRYKNANVISEHTISTDDTRFHDPKYDESQKEIISEVENNTPTADPQKVTFTNLDPKIQKLIAEQKAQVKLITDNVFYGWEAKFVDEANGNYNVEVTSPAKASPGTFAQPVVEVTYSNGSKDIIPLLVVVKPNHTQSNDIDYTPEAVKGTQGQQMESTPKTRRVIGSGAPTQPASYTLDKSTLPQGWTADIDEKTGKLTVTAPDDAPNNQKFDAVVTATYPDGTTDTATVPFQVVISAKVPEYEAKADYPDTPVTLPPNEPQYGIDGSEDAPMPSRYTFPDGTNQYTRGDWTFTVDETTGEVSTTIPENALPGASITVPVQLHYPNGIAPQITTATVSVIDDKEGEDKAQYPPQLVKAGDEQTAPFFSKLKDPSKATFELADPSQVPDDWEITFNQDGSVTAKSPAGAQPGDEINFDVKVTYPDGSEGKVPAQFTVVSFDADVNDPFYPTKTVPAGSTVQSPVDLTHVKPDKIKKYAIDPEYKAPVGVEVSIDEATGEVTTKVGENVKPGTALDIPVIATYQDDSEDRTLATVTVLGSQKQLNNPQYKQQETAPGKAKQSPLETPVPEKNLDGDKPFSVPDTVDGWTVSVDKQGVVTATPPADAKAGDSIEVPVTVKYEDGSSTTVHAPFVVKVDRDVHEPFYEVKSTRPNTAVDHQIGGAPEGSKFKINQPDVDGWKYEIDPDSGKVTVTPPANAKPGDKKTNQVTVTYPDGSTEDVPVTTVVTLGDNYSAEPDYPEQTVYPGGTATSPLTVYKPEGIEVAEDNPYVINPDTLENASPTGKTNEHGNPTYTVTTDNGDWIVGLDNKGNVVATAPKTAKPGDKIQVPVTVTYSDGSTDMTTAEVKVVDVPEREVPFKVEYVYDNTIPAGEYTVETKGVPGAEQQKQDGTWERSKEPVNEVVRVGTKPAENAKDVNWTFPIPYPTEVRANPALAPGETRVVQDGVNGEKTYTAKFTGKGTEAQVAEEETTKQPVTRIVEYGPGIEDQTLTSTETREVAFGIEYVVDDTLEAGKQEVQQEGTPGEEVITSTQEIKDGKPSGKPKISTERTKEPTNAVIRVGTKTTGTNTESYEAEVAFGVKVEFDPTMPAGTSETVTEGKPGVKTVTITRDIVNSKPGDPQITESVTQAPVDQVIKVGTKPTEASAKVSWTAQVPFDVETRPNPQLAPGEVKVAQQGVPGEKTYTADFAATGSDATVTPEEKQTKDPVTEIIEYGPAPADTSVVTKTEKPVPFGTEIVFDNTLDSGTQVVDKQGELGVDVVTSTQKIVGGKPSGDPEVTTERTKEPTNAVIRVGTKTTGETVNSVETEIPYEVEVVYDPSLAPGEQKVTQEGELGLKKVTVTQPVENSQSVGEVKVTEEIVKQPVKKIIAVGSKPSESSKKVTWTAEVPYDVETRPNPQLAPGEVKVAQQGVPGEKTYTADFSATGSDATVTPEEKQTKDPINEIIEYGPTTGDQTLTSTKTREVAFETEIIFDDTLAAGQKVVVQEGAPGEEVITSTQELKDGKPSGKPSISTERTKEPTKAVIRIGTKPVKDSTPTPEPSPQEVLVELPYTTKIVYDPSLKAGEEVEDVKGENGQVKVTVNGDDVQQSVVKEAVQRVVRVGTRPAEGVEYTEERAYGVVVKKDPALKSGEYKVEQEGKPGKVTHKSDGTTETTDPVDHIIVVGTGEKTPGTPGAPDPSGDKGSSDKAQRCVENAFAINSPILWLLPIGLLAAVGAGVNEAFGPQINEMMGGINARIEEQLPDLGSSRGTEDRRPDWLIEIEAQINAANQQFGGAGENLQPLGIALGAIAVIGLLSGLIYQACQPDGFGKPGEGSSN